MEMQNTAVLMENLSYTASDGTALLKHLNIELKKGRRTV